jgi:signal transduction histidine kinase/DNA-binding response OmpR family regulator
MFDRLGTVLTAKSGPEALEILKSRPIDLLITDQKMPDMTGIELVRAARKLGIGVTTILLTAYTNPSDLIAAINEGQVFRYVTKPWDLTDLTMTVRNALSVAQLRKEKERLLESLHKRIEALTVMYEVSRQSAKDAPSLDAIVDRLLSTVGRVLPHDASAVLIEASDGQTAALRIRCKAALNESALLHVKDSVLASHRKAAGVLLPEDRVITNVSGEVGAAPGSFAAFACAISVPLVSAHQAVGTLALFSSRPDAYSTEDGELLDLLVNQTTDAITHVRAAEREARLRVEQMVEAMTDGVVLTDAKGAVMVVNAAARSLLGLSAEEGRPGIERLSNALGLSPFELVRGWEYGGAKIVREPLLLAGRDVELVVTPVAGAQGLQGLVLVLRDVTEQRSLDRRKDEFVGIISHELRTPLTAISGALDLVLGRLAGEVNEKQQRFLTMARESTERLNALVDDLLDLTRSEQGGLSMDFQFTSLEELARQAVERYAAAFQERKLSVSVEVAGDPGRLLGDPVRLAQVVNNLLTNAAKFTPPGGSVRVTVGRADGAPGAVLAVWNSGEPIAEGDLERIFDRFEQARTQRTRNVPGTGLGLSICRSIVEAHGGRIWAESTTDGARFVVVLPEQPPEQPVATAEQPAPGSRGTLLVVDDEPQLAWLLKAQLLAAGYKVVIATRGEEALALARKLRPDVITLDHKLPDVDGLRVLDILRHDPETKACRVLVLSGFDVRDEAARQGAAFLRKPVATASLLASIEGLVKERRGGRGRVLVVDDDPTITAICAEVLTNQGFDVMTAADVAQARLALVRHRPELLLLDVALPDGDGFHFFETLKADRALGPLSVIFISARSDTSAKVRALKLGGDDYLTKPFDALELGARVDSVLRRRTVDTSASPTTQLPGSASIEREVQRRLGERRPFAFCYLDLDNLKAFNDFYGFAKADGVVRQTADILREVVAQLGNGSEFVGHVAGDDFVFMVAPERVDDICRRVIDSFDRIIPLYYEKADRERGYIEGEDRYGQQRQFPIMSVSIAAVMTDATMDHPELARVAAELKKRAKTVTGSVVLRSDRVDLQRSIA